MDQPNFHASKQAFERDGYVLLKQFITGTELAEIQANVTRFIDEKISTLPREYVFHEDRNHPETLKQIQQMGEHDRFFGGSGSSFCGGISVRSYSTLA